MKTELKLVNIIFPWANPSCTWRLLSLIQLGHDILIAEVHEDTNHDHHAVPTEQNGLDGEASFDFEVVDPFNGAQDDWLLNSFDDLPGSWVQETEFSFVLNSLVDHEDRIQVNVWDDFDHVAGCYEGGSFVYWIGYSVKVFLLSG